MVAGFHSRGGVIWKKPHPSDYGFRGESEVRMAVAAEEKRKKVVDQISLFSFLTVCSFATVMVWTIIKFMFPAFSAASEGAGDFLTNLLSGTISAGSGLLLGMFCSFVARLLSGRVLQPSAEYGKAKQYLDANWMWKRRLQREYGYESY